MCRCYGLLYIVMRGWNHYAGFVLFLVWDQHGFGVDDSVYYVTYVWLYLLCSMILFILLYTFTNSKEKIIHKWQFIPMALLIIHEGVSRCRC